MKILPLSTLYEATQPLIYHTFAKVFTEVLGLFLIPLSVKNNINNCSRNACVLLVILSGNDHGKKPYKKGTPCSECSTGKMYCTDGMCDGNYYDVGNNNVLDY